MLSNFLAKDSNRTRGMGRTTCPFFDQLDAVLGTRAASIPPALLESSGTSLGCDGSQGNDETLTETNSGKRKAYFYVVNIWTPLYL